jgi:hypothetical protein
MSMMAARQMLLVRFLVLRLRRQRGLRLLANRSEQPAREYYESISNLSINRRYKKRVPLCHSVPYAVITALAAWLQDFGNGEDTSQGSMVWLSVQPDW